MLRWFEDLEASTEQAQVLEAFATAVKERTGNLIGVGLDYLTLNRSLPSLSVGESQRVRLAHVLSSGLTGVLYVLDEPTTGLHYSDTEKLLKTMRRIQAAGNTVLVIEHDMEVVRQADYIIDVGPGGGSRGGEIVVAGTPAEVMACAQSVTGRYLAQQEIPDVDALGPESGEWLVVRGASEHNLKDIDVRIPTRQLVAITGPSGSGKSTFLFDILDRAARQHFNGASAAPGKHRSIEGLEHFNRIVTVDQLTVRNAQATRSNVATYTKLFDAIRALFAAQPAAKVRGFGADAFSFNTSPHRCEQCNGTGVVAVNMAFMADVESECPACNGRRFSDELLEVKLQCRHVADVLELNVCDAMGVFRDQPKISKLLELMDQVGLGYLTLGQSTATLSGGEAQRIKLASELCKTGRESTLYLLDEPTAGLHPQEVERLLTILRKLVSAGNTVVMIEHNLAAIRAAETRIAFGPGGGVHGGTLV